MEEVKEVEAGDPRNISLILDFYLCGISDKPCLIDSDLVMGLRLVHPAVNLFFHSNWEEQLTRAYHWFIFSNHKISIFSKISNYFPQNMLRLSRNLPEVATRDLDSKIEQYSKQIQNLMIIKLYYPHRNDKENIEKLRKYISWVKALCWLIQFEMSTRPTRNTFESISEYILMIENYEKSINQFADRYASYHHSLKKCIISYEKGDLPILASLFNPSNLEKLFSSKVVLKYCFMDFPNIGKLLTESASGGIQVWRNIEFFKKSYTILLQNNFPKNLNRLIEIHHEISKIQVWRESATNSLLQFLFQDDQPVQQVYHFLKFLIPKILWCDIDNRLDEIFMGFLNRIDSFPLLKKVLGIALLKYWFCRMSSIHRQPIYIQILSRFYGAEDIQWFRDLPRSIPYYCPDIDEKVSRVFRDYRSSDVHDYVNLVDIYRGYTDYLVPSMNLIASIQLYADSILKKTPSHCVTCSKHTLVCISEQLRILEKLKWPKDSDQMQKLRSLWTSATVKLIYEKIRKIDFKLEEKVAVEQEEFVYDDDNDDDDDGDSLVNEWSDDDVLFINTQSSSDYDEYQ